MEYSGHCSLLERDFPSPFFCHNRQKNPLIFFCLIPIKAAQPREVQEGPGSATSVGNTRIEPGKAPLDFIGIILGTPNTSIVPSPPSLHP